MKVKGLSKVPVARGPPKVPVARGPRGQHVPYPKN